MPALDQKSPPFPWKAALLWLVPAAFMQVVRLCLGTSDALMAQMEGAGPYDGEINLIFVGTIWVGVCGALSTLVRPANELLANLLLVSFLLPIGLWGMLIILSLIISGIGA